MWGQGASGGQPASSFLFGQPVAPQTAPAPAFGFGASSQAPAQAQPGAFAFGQVSAAQSAPAGAGQLLFGQPVGGAGATAAQASAPANDQVSVALQCAEAEVEEQDPWTPALCSPCFASATPGSLANVFIRSWNERTVLLCGCCWFCSGLDLSGLLLVGLARGRLAPLQISPQSKQALRPAPAPSPTSGSASQRRPQTTTQKRPAGGHSARQGFKT